MCPLSLQYYMLELLTGAPGKKMRAECSPTRVKKAYIWHRSSVAQNTRLSLWRSRVRVPSVSPRTKFDMLRFQFLLNAIDKAEKTLGVSDRRIRKYGVLAQFWQSTCLASRRSRVRFPQAPPYLHQLKQGERSASRACGVGSSPIWSVPYSSK